MCTLLLRNKTWNKKLENYFVDLRLVILCVQYIKLRKLMRTIFYCVVVNIWRAILVKNHLTYSVFLVN